MSFRISVIIWTIMIVLGAFGVYMVKYKVQDLKKEVALTEKLLAEEKKNLHVLKAEWAFLTRPDRIRKLSAKYLNVKPMMGKQITELASLPYSKVIDTNPQNVADNKNASASTIKLVSGAEISDNAGDE